MIALLFKFLWFSCISSRFQAGKKHNFGSAPSPIAIQESNLFCLGLRTMRLPSRLGAPDVGLRNGIHHGICIINNNLW
jgi:hypothetical protein